MEKNSLSPIPGDAILVIDVQNDFLPGGSLAVPEGDRVVPVLNRYIGLFRSRDLPVFFTRDWHPANHCSFKEQGGPWPPHCVIDSEGADFAPGLDRIEADPVVSKADNPARESYSNFEGTDLKELLGQREVRRLFVGGLATDYCVLNTVVDALKLGFEVVLLTDAVRAVDVNPGDGERALSEMAGQGARPADYGTVARE